MKLDLHGKTVHAAWREYRKVTEDCYYRNIKKIVVVTGHGKMSTEFHGWVSADPYAIECERLDPNKGAWRVRIRSAIHRGRDKDPVDLTGLYKKFNKR